MNAKTAPAAKGAMVYHSMLTQVPTCPTSFHQLYSIVKLAARVIAQKLSVNSTASMSRFRIFEGRIRDCRTFYSRADSKQRKVRWIYRSIAILAQPPCYV